MQMLIAGDWTDGSAAIPVINPFDNSEIDTVPKATTDEIERALAYAVEGAKKVKASTGYDRYNILMRAAELMVRQFGLELDVREAELTPLGRKLAGVDAW